MANLKLIKRIVNKNVINSFNLMLNVLFGGKEPELYDENKVYNKGDCVIVEVDGVYKLFTILKNGVTGPVDFENMEEVVFTEMFKENSVIMQGSMEIHNKQEALSDDLATLVYELAGLIDNRLALKVLYRENFRNSDHLNITTGLHIPGSIQAIPKTGLDFKLSEPAQLAINPVKFKLKHLIEISGAPTLGCKITFNALDKKPYWFDASEALLSADFFEIPVDLMQKEEDVPYAMNIQIYGDCPDQASIKISDLMVVFI